MTVNWMGEPRRQVLAAEVVEQRLGNRLEERIRAHVLLCWLALLLVRVVENTTGATWRSLAAELNRLHVITFTGPDGTFRQCTELTKPQRDIYAKLQLDPPAKIIELATAAR